MKTRNAIAPYTIQKLALLKKVDPFFFCLGYGV